MKRLVAALVVLAVTPAFAYDKCDSPQGRMKEVLEAARLKDAPRLAACYAPPFDALGKPLIEAGQKYDEKLNRILQVVPSKLDPEAAIPKELLEEPGTPTSFFGAEKIFIPTTKDAAESSLVKLKWVTNEGELFGDVLVVLRGDDWRLVYGTVSPEPWPAGAAAEAKDQAARLVVAFEKAAASFEAIAKDIETKDVPAPDVKERLAQTRAGVKEALAGFATAHAKALEAEKAAKTAADQERAKAAAEAERLKNVELEKIKAAEAEKKKAAEAEKKAEAEKAAKARAAEKKTDPKAPSNASKDEPVAEKEKPAPDNTGTFVVLGLLGIICVVVIGVVISKAKGGEGAPRGRREGGSSPKRGDTGRRRRPGKR